MFEQIQANWRQLQQMFENTGGVTMTLLGFLSIMAVAFILERTFRLRRGRIVPRGLASEADRMWQEGNIRGLLDLPRKNNSALARAIALMTRHRKAPLGEVSLAVSELGVRELRPHLRRTFPLMVVATIAPLLGLFGTVIGMMGAFSRFQLAGDEGDPSLFAGDISFALGTTAAGLAVAIPALAFYHFFKGRANKLGDELENDVSDLLNAWLLPIADETPPTDGPRLVGEEQ